MAWVKIPAEHHPIFHAVVPRDPRITMVPMFGGVVAKTNGHMAAGLFARSVIVRLSPADRDEALRLDGAEPFDPMDRGQGSKEVVLLPEDVMDQRDELRDWIRRALEFTNSLPAKAAKPARPPAAKRAMTKQPAASKPAASKPAAVKAAPTKPDKPARTAARSTSTPVATKPATKKPAPARSRGR
jgi:TfoX/Sxy family transcriptional regulator of competence genes